MSYEREAVAETSSAIPAQAPAIMREERVIEPYRVQAPTKLSQESKTIGQETTNKSPEKSEETKTSPAETVTLSPAAAALARKELKFRQAEQELKAREQSLEAERAEIAELKAMKEKLKAKDFSAVESLVPYDDYVTYLTSKAQSVNPESQAVQKLADEVNALKKAQADDISQRFDAAVEERRKAVTSLVDSNEEFSSIKELKMHEAVVQHILDTWEHDNIDLDPEQAAREVEEILLEKGAKWASLTKIKGKGQPVADKKELPPLKPGVKTLTNNMVATGEIVRPNRSFEGMTDAERYAEARRRAEAKLKKE